MAKLKRTEFSTAVAELAKERGIKPTIVIDSIEEALLAAYKRDTEATGQYHSDWQYEVELDDVSGSAKIFGYPEEKPDQRQEVTPPDFGRIAAQVAKQVILQKIQEAEKSAIINDYRQRVGTIVLGTVIRKKEEESIVVDIGRTHGILPRTEQIEEDYSIGNKFNFYIKEISEEEGVPSQIILSRASVELTRGLFEREVPEISNGAVEIRAIARDPGWRTKVGVFSTRRRIDPVGACVGQKGVRVAEVIKALGGEKVDVIQYNENPKQFIAAALLPAEELSIEIDKENKIARVMADENQLSLAIGKNGQNIRLASQISGYQINIQEKKSEKPAVKKKIKNEAKEK